MSTMWITVGTSIINESGLKEAILTELGSDKQQEWLMDIEEKKEISLPPKLDEQIELRAKAYKEKTILSALGPELFSLLKSQYSSEINKVVFIVSKNKQNLISFVLIKAMLKKIIRNESLPLSIEPPIIIEDVDTEANTAKFIQGIKNLWSNLDSDSNLNYGTNNVLSIIGGLKATTTVLFQWAMQSSSTNRILYAFNSWEKPIELELPRIKVTTDNEKNISTNDNTPNLVVTIGTQLMTGIKKFLEEPIKVSLLESQLKKSEIKPILESLSNYFSEKTDSISSDDWISLCKLLLGQGDNKELFGPEIRAIHWFVENKKVNKIVLLHTKTESNRRIAKVIAMFAESLNKTVDLSEFSDEIGKADSVQAGINSLLNICSKKIKSGDYVFSLGGYKHAIAIVTTHALSVGARCYYMHREWNKPEEVYPYKFSYSEEWALEIVSELNKEGEAYRTLEKVLWTGSSFPFPNANNIFLSNILKGVFNYDHSEELVSLTAIGKIVRQIIRDFFNDFERNYNYAIKSLQKINLRKRINEIILTGIHSNDYQNKIPKMKALFRDEYLQHVKEIFGAVRDQRSYGSLIDLKKSNINELVILSDRNVENDIDLQLYWQYEHHGTKSRYSHLRFTDNETSLSVKINTGIIIKNLLIGNTSSLVTY